MARRDLNRIYITERMMAESLYKRSKERGFTTEDLMRMHWDRQGKRALAWARERIKRMKKAKVIETIEATKDPKDNDVPEGDKRRRYYRFAEEKLIEWNLN